MDYCLHLCQITSVNKIHDYWQVVTDKYTMNIFNCFYLENTPHGSYHDLNVINYCKITNSKIQNGDKLVFSIDNGCELVISLCDEDYNGPEALQVIFTSGDIVVF